MSEPRRSRTDRVDALLAAGPPLEYGEWALERASMEIVLAEVAAGRRRVAECGSGVSTILIARLLREFGAGQVFALEHSVGWAHRIRARIVSEGLAAYVSVIDAPLERDPLAPPGCRADGGRRDPLRAELEPKPELALPAP